MKNIIKLITFGVFIFTLSSCDDKELPYEFVDLGANVIIKDKSITVFDRNEKLDILIFTKSGIGVNSIQLKKIVRDNNGKITNKNTIDNAQINGNTATFNAVTLAPYDQFGKDKDERYGKFELELLSTLSNGKTINNKSEVSVGKALKFKEEIESIEYENPYNYKDKNGNTINKRIIYKVSTAQADIDAITLEWKNKKGGTYAAIAKPLKIKGDTIDLKKTLEYKNAPYNLKIGDTLYYKFTLKKGSIEESHESKVAIVTQPMLTSSSNTLSNIEKFYNFSKESKKEDGAEITYVNPQGFKAAAANNIKFVKSPLIGDDASAYYDNGGLFEAKRDFESGSATNTVSGVTKGDVYIYKIERKSISYYGLIKIGNIVNTGTANETLDISFKEGTFR